MQLEKNILSGDADLQHPNLRNVTQEAKNFLQCLLVVPSVDRWSAGQCLRHKWLWNVDASEAHTSQSIRLETSKLRSWLARRRWMKCCAAVRGAIRITKAKDVKTRKSVTSCSNIKSYLNTDHCIEMALGDTGLRESGLHGRWKVSFYKK